MNAETGFGTAAVLLTLAAAAANGAYPWAAHAAMFAAMGAWSVVVALILLGGG